MGANVYLEAVASYGYKTASAGVQIEQNIPGQSGKRIAIRAFNFGCGGTATTVYFMQSLGKTTLLAAVASGGSVLNLVGEPGPSGNSLAANDYICVIQDNGVYHFSKVGAVTGLSTIVLCTVVTGAIAAGNAMYDLGVYTDTGHLRYLLTATTGSNEELDGGIFYGAEKGSPMKVWHANDAAAAGDIKYLTVDYINK